MTEADDTSADEVRVRVLAPPPSLRDLMERGLFTPTLFGLADGTYTAEFIAKIPSMPSIRLGGRLHQVPEPIVELPPQAEVLIRQREGDRVLGRDAAVQMLQAIADRQTSGMYHLNEVAEIISSARGSSFDLTVSALQGAIRSNALRYRNARSLLPIDRPPDFESHLEADEDGEWVLRAEDIDSWLEAEGVSYRLGELASTGSVSAPESKTTREDRRLARFQELGGRVVKAFNRNNVESEKVEPRGILAQLAREEQEAGRPYSDNSDVGKDVRAAAARQRSARTMPGG